MTKEWTDYVPIVTSAHEMMRAAAVLCDEAREIEKAATASSNPTRKTA
jgi:methylenetetrahydromethanopterin dehydrogenase